jgi:folate-binding protein YgfZ
MEAITDAASESPDDGERSFLEGPLMPLARLDDRAVVAVTGPDARPFLHNLLTQDVESLELGQLRHAALLTPQGRILHDMLLWGAKDGVRLDLAAAAVEDLVRRLTLYKLRAKVQIALTDEQVWAAWGEDSPPPPAGELARSAGGGTWRSDPRTPMLGFRALTPPSVAFGDTSRASGGVERYHRHRIAFGIPDVQADSLHDRAYPLEADYDLLHAIDFKKGCFIGQETTSRMHRRGTLKTRLLRWPSTARRRRPAPKCSRETAGG